MLIMTTEPVYKLTELVFLRPSSDAITIELESQNIGRPRENRKREKRGIYA